MLTLLTSGTALLSISGAPNVEGLTIDTAAQDHKIIDKWANGLRDVSVYFCETVEPRGGQITAGGKKVPHKAFSCALQTFYENCILKT